MNDSALSSYEIALAEVTKSMAIIQGLVDKERSVRPRYKAWPAGDIDVARNRYVEIVRANNEVERVQVSSLCVGFYRTEYRRLDKRRFIAYRVIEQEGEQ